MLAVVGFEVMLQQTPLAATAIPPSLLIFPPDIAEVLVILEIEAVERAINPKLPEIQRTENPSGLSPLFRAELMRSK